MKNLIRKWLGIVELEEELKATNEIYANLLLHNESKLNGYAVLKKHLNRPDKPLPLFMGKDIEQD